MPESLKITFDEIEEGDRLRVSHSMGSTHEYGYEHSGIERTLIAVAALKAFDKVWINADGHPVAHRSWKNLRIVKLLG